jgi:hypothetical protein
VGQGLPHSGGRLPFWGRACPSGEEADLLRGRRAQLGEAVPFWVVRIAYSSTDPSQFTFYGV